MYITKLRVALFCLVLISGCGGGGDSSLSPSAATPERTSVLIGPAGGTAALPSNDLKIYIPPAALSKDVQVVLTISSEPVPNGNIGRTFSLAPDGTDFASPILVTVKYDPELLPKGINEESLVLAYASGSHWVEYPTIVDTINKLLIGEVAHFSQDSVVVETVVTSIIDGVNKSTVWSNSGGCLTSGDGAYDGKIAELSNRLFGNKNHCLTNPYLANGYSRHLPNLENHAGLDFRASEASGGTPAYALFDGTVVNEKLDAVAGRSTLAILSSDGKFKIYYLHCQSHAYLPVTSSGRSGKPELAIGDLVFIGDQICNTGSVGAKGGAHLHVELKATGMDPYDTPSTTALGGNRCAENLGTTFNNFAGKSTSGCDFEYIKNNTLDPVMVARSMTCKPPMVFEINTCVTSSNLAQIINFTGLGNQNLRDIQSTLSATSTSGLTVTLTSLTGSVCVVTGKTLILIAAGTCTINANQAGNSTFAPAATVSRSFTVGPATLQTQTIVFNSITSQTLGVTPPPLSATSTSGLPVTVTSVTKTICDATGTTLTLISTGTCTINANQPGNSTFSPASTVSRSFTVNPIALQNQSITFNTLGSQILGVAPPALLAVASSGLPVILTSATPSACAVTGATLTLSATGICTVDANQSGNSTFAPAITVSRSFTITAAPAPSLTGTYSGAASDSSGSGTMTWSLTQVGANVSGAIVLKTPRGSTIFDGTISGTLSSSTLLFTIAVPVGGITGLPNCSVNVVGAANTVSNSAISGTYSGTNTCTPPFTNGIFSLVRDNTILQPQSITFDSPRNQTIGVASSLLVATSSSGLPVSFTANTYSVCTVSGTALTLVALGTCTVSASQIGNGAYAPAPIVSRSFTVNPAALLTQTITFSAPAAQTLGVAPPPLSATSSSSLPVSFSSVTTAVCIATGTTLTLVSAGTCTINANQVGNFAYAAAPAVSRSFGVAPAVATPSPDLVPSDFGFTYSLDPLTARYSTINILGFQVMNNGAVSAPVSVTRFEVRNAAGVLWIGDLATPIIAANLLWNPGSLNLDLSSLAVGQYTLTVTVDATGIVGQNNTVNDKISKAITVY